MRRIVALFVVAVLGMGMIGCGESAPAPAPAAPAAPAAGAPAPAAGAPAPAAGAPAPAAGTKEAPKEEPKKP